MEETPEASSRNVAIRDLILGLAHALVDDKDTVSVELRADTGE